MLMFHMSEVLPEKKEKFQLVDKVKTLALDTRNLTLLTL